MQKTRKIGEIMSTFEPSIKRILGFAVEINGISVDGWTNIKIPASSTEPGAGNGEDTWGETTFQDVEMERWVVPDDTVLHDWREAIVDGDDNSGLKDVEVTAIDETGASVIRWTFTDAWIKYYEPLQIDIDGDGIATERITLGYDSMERETL